MEHNDIANLAPGLYKDHGEFVYNPKIAVPEGERRGIKYIGEFVQHRSRKFNERFIQDLHAQVVYYMPGVAGLYRQSGRQWGIAGSEESVVIKGYKLVNGEKVPVEYNLCPSSEVDYKMKMFGSWLEDKTELLKENIEDPLGALKLASEATYGLVSPELHPFYDGNGRVARLLANSILMINAHELMYYGIKILPVPRMRFGGAGSVDIALGKSSDVVDPYLLILNDIHGNHILNQLDLFLAKLWRNNLGRMVDEYHTKYEDKLHVRYTQGDRTIIAKFQSRINILDKFILEQEGLKAKNNDHIVPNYFKRLSTG